MNSIEILSRFKKITYDEEKDFLRNLIVLHEGEYETRKNLFKNIL